MLDKVYRIEGDGEVSSLQVNSYDDLSPQFAYVLVTDRRARKIYVWKGTGSNVRMKFMAARYALNLRMEVGMVYKTVNIDQGYEDAEFLTHLGGEAVVTERPYGLNAISEEQPPQDIGSHFQAAKTPLEITSSTEVSYETSQSVTSNLPLPLASKDSVIKRDNSAIRKWGAKKKTGVLNMSDISFDDVPAAPSSPLASSNATASTSEAIPTFQKLEQEAAKDFKTEPMFIVLPESEFHTLNGFLDDEWPNYSFEKIGRNSEPEEWHQRSSIVLRDAETLACANFRVTGGTVMVENLIIKQDLNKRETIREDLLNEVEKFAFRKNCHKLVVMLPSQSILVAFFEKRGWTTEARFPNDYFGQSWDRLVKFLS